MKSFVILSAYRGANTNAQNMQQANRMRWALRDLELSFTDAVGAYREEVETEYHREVSHIVEIESDKDFEALLYLAQIFEQDSILHIQQNTESHLFMTNGVFNKIGHFQLVSEEDAKLNGCYTYVNGAYFICK